LSAFFASCSTVYFTANGKVSYFCSEGKLEGGQNSAFSRHLVTILFGVDVAIVMFRLLGLVVKLFGLHF